MTTQPWTPERALAMFKDWDDPDLTMHEFCEKWYVAYNPDDFARIAIEALESATAEIERQRARAEAAERDAATLRDGTRIVREGLLAEVERLRAELAHAKGERDAYSEELGEHIGARDRLALAGEINVGEELADAVKRLKAELALCVTRADRLEGMLAKAQTELAIERQRQQQPEPVAVPSDEEIRKAINQAKAFDQAPWAMDALCLIARRVGVRL